MLLYLSKSCYFKISLAQWIRIDFVGCYTVRMVIWLILWFCFDCCFFFVFFFHCLFPRRSFWSLLFFIALMHFCRSCARILFYFFSCLCLYSYLCSLCSCVLVHFSLPLLGRLPVLVHVIVYVCVSVCVNLCVLKACGSAWVTEVFICQ